MRPASALFSMLALALGACGSDGASDDPTGAGGRAGAAGTSGAPNAGTPSCAEGPGYTETVEPQLVGEVSALLVDQSGEPLALEPIQICGLDVCLFYETAETGGFRVGPEQAIRKPAFKVGEGKHTAKFALLLPTEPVIDLGTVQGVRLPELGQGVTLAAGEPASSGGLTLLPAEGSRVRIDTIVFRTQEEKQLRALRIPLASAPLVAADHGFEIAYAAAPPDTEFCPPAKLAIENSEGWDAGTDVEVWLHGTDITERWAPYGGWAKVSDARVSEDGTRVETTEPGLPMLGVLAFKRRE